MDTDKIYAERIASEYAPKDASKVVALRKLDARAKRPATVFGYAFGIVSSLLLGVGMCLSMGVMGGCGLARAVRPRRRRGRRRDSGRGGELPALSTRARMGQAALCL